MTSPRTPSPFRGEKTGESGSSVRAAFYKRELPHRFAARPLPSRDAVVIVDFDAKCWARLFVALREHRTWTVDVAELRPGD